MNSTRNESGAGRSAIVLVLFILIFGFLLFTEHRAHALAPWLVLLACLLMHMLMHGKHGDHTSHGAPGGRGRKTEGRS